MIPSKRRELAQALSTVENRANGWREILARSFRTPNEAVVIGLSGPAGAGKSTLVDGLTAHWASTGEEVAVIAIDPSSPFSGGAVLGDRVRMHRSENLESVFIRSVSTRGSSGGLNEAAIDFAAVMAAFGIKRILLEAVGAGQSETDIAFAADCIVVVAVPGLGDIVQATKAGLLEIGDVYVVNKSDLPGADVAVRDLVQMTHLMEAGRQGRNRRRRASPALDTTSADTSHQDTWRPPVLRTCATDQGTIGVLANTIEEFLAWAAETNLRNARRTRRAAFQLRQIIKRRAIDRFAETGTGRSQGNTIDHWAEKVAQWTADPHSAADLLFETATDVVPAASKTGEDQQ